jgi:hypothetical protein
VTTFHRISLAASLQETYNLRKTTRVLIQMILSRKLHRSCLDPLLCSLCGSRRSRKKTASFRRIGVYNISGLLHYSGTNGHSDIWVRTSYAWYILDRPSPEYRDIYLPRWLHHKLYILVLHLLKKSTPTVSLFERHFLRNEAKWATYEFGRELTLSDLRKRVSLKMVLRFHVI